MLWHNLFHSNELFTRAPQDVPTVLELWVPFFALSVFAEILVFVMGHDSWHWNLESRDLGWKQSWHFESWNLWQAMNAKFLFSIIYLNLLFLLLTDEIFVWTYEIPASNMRCSTACSNITFKFESFCLGKSLRWLRTS